jgi:hypothetical protein
MYAVQTVFYYFFKFDFQIFWNSGCQLVSLNFQTPDLPMQLILRVEKIFQKIYPKNSVKYLLKKFMTSFIQKLSNHHDRNSGSILSKKP